MFIVINNYILLLNFKLSLSMTKNKKIILKANILHPNN